MRQIEKSMLAAIRSGRSWKQDNTEVITDKGVSRVYLHGNLIADVQHGRVVAFSLCGWNTPTTRSRLNALGLDVRCKNGRAVYNGEVISSRDVIHVAAC